RQTRQTLNAADVVTDNEQLSRQSLSAADEDVARRHSRAVGALVEAPRAAIGALNEHIRQVERQRLTAYSSLREQVASMRHTSHQLTSRPVSWSRRCARLRYAADGARSSWSEWSSRPG
ncbi:hypothetical protein ABZ894_31270, partial [Nocardia beijingensis]